MKNAEKVGQGKDGYGREGRGWGREGRRKKLREGKGKEEEDQLP